MRTHCALELSTNCANWMMWNTYYILFDYLRIVRSWNMVDNKRTKNRSHESIPIWICIVVCRLSFVFIVYCLWRSSLFSSNTLDMPTPFTVIAFFSYCFIVRWSIDVRSIWFSFFPPNFFSLTFCFLCWCTFNVNKFLRANQLLVCEHDTVDRTIKYSTNKS